MSKIPGVYSHILTVENESESYIYLTKQVIKVADPKKKAEIKYSGSYARYTIPTDGNGKVGNIKDSDLFTDRPLHGGILSKHTRSLGLDQLLYKAYDNYPEPTMQYNSIVKYLIQQTSVISAVPKAFAALFQGIWGGVGS